MITINNRRGSEDLMIINTRRGTEDLIVITSQKRGDTDQAQFGDMEFGAFEFGNGKIDISDNGAIIINNKGASL